MLRETTNNKRTRTNRLRLTNDNLEINHKSKQLTKGTGYQPSNEVSHNINTGCHSNKYAAVQPCVPGFDHTHLSAKENSSTIIRQSGQVL